MNTLYFKNKAQQNDWVSNSHTYTAQKFCSLPQLYATLHFQACLI